MDRLLATGSSLSALQSFTFAARDAASAPSAPWASRVAPDPAGVFEAVKGGDPAAEQQRMPHFISHIDAECFISLLQILDPKPDDYQARTQYRRYYQQLREALELPPPPLDPQPQATSTDPLW